MKKIRTALLQLITGTCDKAKKYKGDKKTEKGIRNNLIVDAESILPAMFHERYDDGMRIEENVHCSNLRCMRRSNLFFNPFVNMRISTKIIRLKKEKNRSLNVLDPGNVLIPKTSQRKRITNK